MNVINMEPAQWIGQGLARFRADRFIHLLERGYQPLAGTIASAWER